MFIEQISGQNIKIKFDVNEKQLLLGDVLKITASGKSGVLAQVIDISTADKNPNFNIAESKILYTIDSTGKLVSWQGNIPSQDFLINKISSHELLLSSNTLSPPNPIPVGDLSLYPDVKVDIEASFLEAPTVIYCDKQTQKDNILSVLAIELSKNCEKTVLIDFNGSYPDLKVSKILEAGKDIKLPFNIRGLELLYNKSLANLAPETRAAIEDIFIEIENYLSSGKVEFIPFSNFRQAVNSVYETNRMPELVLLKNKLLKLQKLGIFADRRDEITSFTGNINVNNLVILDLSKFSPEWQKDLVEFLIDSNTNTNKQNFFLLIDVDKMNADKAFIENLCVKANKNGIKPIIISGHETDLAIPLLSYTKNIIAFAPENTTKVTALKNQLIRLKDNEAVITGKITNNIPLYVNIFDLEAFAESHRSDDTRYSVHILPEIYLSTEIEEPRVKKPQEDSFNYSDQFAYDESKIELVDNISNLQEEVSIPVRQPSQGEQKETGAYFEEESSSEIFSTDENYEDKESDFQDDYGLEQEEAYDEAPQVTSFYDEFNPEPESQAGFDGDLSNFVDLEEEQGDENFDYDSNQELFDESILDYSEYNEEQQDDENFNYGLNQEFPEASSYNYPNYNNAQDYGNSSGSDQIQLEDIYDEYADEEAYLDQQKEPVTYTNKDLPPKNNIPLYSPPKNPEKAYSDTYFQEGDKVKHEKYGIGTVIKIIGTNEKKLCSIQFEDVGRRLLDPNLAGLEKLE